MGTKFDALDELLDDTLTLPVCGREYVIPSPDAETGLRIQRLTNTAATLVAGGEVIDTELLDDGQELDLYRMALGPVYDQLLAHEVKWSWLRHAALTAVIWVTSDAATAEAYWKAGGGAPNSPAPNRATRRSSSAAEKLTRKRGSTSGTSTPPATARARKAKKT